MESECIRARERELGSKRREVMWGEQREGLGRLSFEAWTTTIRGRLKMMTQTTTTTVPFEGFDGVVFDVAVVVG